MFSDDILTQIFEHEKAKRVPIMYQTLMIKAIEEVLEQEEERRKYRNATIYKS